MRRIHRARWLVIWIGLIAVCAAAGGVAAEPGATLLGVADGKADATAVLRVAYSTRGVIRGNRIVRIEVGPAGLESISPLVPKSISKDGSVLL